MGFRIIKEKRSDSKTLELYDDNGIEQVQEISDIAQTIKELNDDSVHDRFTNIDTKTRLHNTEIASIIALDSLVALKFLPEEVSFITRSKKRLAVSLKGEGRKEIVQISQGVREQQGGTSFLSRLGGLFGGGN